MLMTKRNESSKLLLFWLIPQIIKAVEKLPQLKLKRKSWYNESHFTCSFKTEMWLTFSKASFTFSVLFENTVSPYILSTATELHYGFSWYLNLSKWSLVTLPMSPETENFWRVKQLLHCEGEVNDLTYDTIEALHI